ncbi:MAG: radical SAM protein [bacterium]
MCYAIPAKVVEINDNIVTVDYFGEKRKARNDFFKLTPGEYVYAQGGFIIRQIPTPDALSILNTWQEFFFKLKETDLRLTREAKTLYQQANSIRQKHLGNACCVHGIIEFSNWCQNNCLYCGLRRDNTEIKRYRMQPEEIIEHCAYVVNELNFKALVLQSGEDPWYTEEKLITIVENIMRRTPVLLILSLGERDIAIYKRLYDAGARAVLIRFETSNPQLYERYRPNHKLKDRINLVKELYQLGYLIFSGFLVGLPQQTEEDILNDVELTASLNAEMFSFGPFIPHPQTPLSNAEKPSLETALTTVARARIRYPQSRILVTTALETIDKEEGLIRGLLSGGNSLMINLTPQKYRPFYDIYPGHTDGNKTLSDKIEEVVTLLQCIGRAPTDLGL